MLRRIFSSSLGWGVLVACAFAFGGCTHAVDRTAWQVEAVEVIARDDATLVDATQCLLVINEPAPNHRHATAWLLERLSTDDWSVIRGPIACSVGANGVARSGEKVEGDKMTPSGTYTLTEALGRDAVVNTKLAYRQATDDDAWDERPDSPTYNQWVSGDAAKGLTERLGADSELMRVCIVVDYNRWPVVPGKGSAIFLHVWSGPGKPTAGCVAAAEADVRRLLGWLDRARRPVVVVAAE